MPDVTEGASDDGRDARSAAHDPAETRPGRAPILVLGTTNAGKVRELLALVAPHGLTCRSLSEMAGAVEVDETGATFAENAALKAVMQARALGHWVLAEDSGLVVPALDGEPGVRSARFAGPPAPGDGTPADERNNRLLLDRLAGMSGMERSAWYACHAVLADPTGHVVAEATGTCHGLITRARRGTGGFGYDPLFLVRECHRTFAEIGPSYKAIVSHRGRALRAMLPLLVKALRAP
ncbi:MAG TPA: non-canonical purine NTP pyrophosphatase [Planctomycetaceae bacterium]|nr:non-canonical purine NTP pyrophosphatase [Planctomycetaceae bacterium]